MGLIDDGFHHRIFDLNRDDQAVGDDLDVSNPPFRHTAAVHLARAGMPLHLLQQQLGHKNIEQTMRHARFHPDYGDVSEYFDRMAADLGLKYSLGHTPAAETEPEVQRERV